jgi:hypothetical protein
MQAVDRSLLREENDLLIFVVADQPLLAILPTPGG